MNALPSPVRAAPSRTVLIVDASRTKRRLVRAHLAPLGCEVSEAATLAEARGRLAGGGIEILLTGWLLPDGAGTDLCRELKEGGGATYAILLTGHSGGAAEGLRAGADDFVTVPVKGDELRARIQAGTRLLDAQRAAIEARRRAEDALSDLRGAQAAMDRDLAEARQLQRSLVPQEGADLGPARIAVLYESSGEVGGDLLGWFRMPGRRVGIWAIDVSGHGVGAALMTARLKGFLSHGDDGRHAALGPRGPLPPAKVAARLNTLTLEEMRTDLYFTLFYADLDLDRGRLSFVQAGHPPPLLLRGGEGRFLGRGGMPVGLIDDAFYTDESLDLRAGDRLLIYSDGITECEGPTGMLEEEGLRALAAAAGNDLLGALRDGLSRHTAGAPPQDDVSALLLDFHG